MTDTIASLELDRLRDEIRERNIAGTAAARAVADYWQDMPRPYAVATSAAPNRTYPGHYVVTVQCPYCGAGHSHGWAGPGTVPGHRVPHCTDPTARKISARGYIVAIPADMDVPPGTPGRHFPAI